MPDAPHPILDSLDIGVIVLNSDRQVVCWNYWIQSATNIAAPDAVGKTLAQIFPTLKLSRVIAAIDAALEAGIASVITHSLHPDLFPLRTRSGKKLLHNIMIGAVGDRSPFGQCAIQILDITAAFERESLLRSRQNARYAAVVDSATDVILTLDGAGIIQHVNPATTKQLGYAAADVMGKSAGVLFQAQSGWNAIWRALIAEIGTVPPTEVAAVRKDGSTSYMEVSAARWESNGRKFASAILRDVNERRQIETLLKEMNTTLEARVAERTAQLQSAEDALRQSQKMEAIGQLTGGIAHDFNNLLQGIMGALNLIQKYVFTGRANEIEKFITGAQASANRAAGLIHRLLAFSRRQPIDPRALEIGRLVASVEDLLRRSIGERISLAIETPDDLWLVRCDANQLENALLNLAINARDAMPEGGTIAVTVANTVLDDRQAKMRDVPAGEYVQLSVTDTGTGMDADVKSRAFDPFYTTKPIGQGTGLGLSMIYGFVRQSQGGVWIDSEKGKGTAINILLPRFKGALEAEDAAAPPAEPHVESNKVVLVVEDEFVVRLLVTEVLKELGYVALEAEDGASALRILETAPRIDLLITDIGLPGLNGRQLADAARVKRSDMRILFMTGYAETASGTAFLDKGMEIITKPFDMDVIAKRIRTLLDDPTA